jgi:tol-pal system protein YbgF
MRRALVLVALAFAALPAAAQGLFDDNEARRRVEILRGQLNEHTRAVDERLGKIEAAVSGAGDRSAVLELASQIESMRGELARVRGQLEVLANQAELAERRQKDLYLDIDTRLRKLEQAQEQAAAAAQPAAAQKPAAAPSEPQEASAAEAKAYQAALDQFKLGNYALAVTAMQNFLAAHPQSALASNAQYWVGMAHSGQRDYKSAIAAQRKLLATWPESQKAPDALLSIASAQETMGDRKTAQKTLEELIAKYPDSSAAASAKQRLAAAKR